MWNYNPNMGTAKEKMQEYVEMEKKLEAIKQQ